MPPRPRRSWAPYEPDAGDSPVVWPPRWDRPERGPRPRCRTPAPPRPRATAPAHPARPHPATAPAPTRGPGRYHPPVPIAPNDFVHLHLHTEFSLLDGLGRINDLVSEASAHGFDALAITDHGALYGAVAFYQACKAKGIKPIIGVEAYVARRSMTDREGKADAQPLPRHAAGQGLDGLPEPLPHHHRGAPRRLLLQAAPRPRAAAPATARASSACRPAWAARSPRPSRSTTGTRLAASPASTATSSARMASCSSSMDHGLPEQRALNPKLLRLSEETGAGLVVTNDLHYVRKDQHEAHDVLLCVGTGSNLDTPNRLRFETNEFYLKTAAEMELLFKDVPARAHQHEARRGHDGPADDLRRAAPAALPGAGRLHRGDLAARRVRARPGAPLRHRRPTPSASASTTSSASSSPWATRPTSSSWPTSRASPASRASPPPAGAAPPARS